MNITPTGFNNSSFESAEVSAKVHSPDFTATPMSSDSLPWDDPFIAPLLVLWLYLPGYLSNTAAMLGGKWIPDMTGIPVYTIDGGRVLSDGNRMLGDGKTWNGLLGGTIGGGILGVLTHSFARDNLVTSAPFLDPVSSYGTSSAEISDAWFYMGGGLCFRARMYGRRLSRVIRQEKKGPQERGRCQLQSTASRHPSIRSLHIHIRTTFPLSLSDRKFRTADGHGDTTGFHPNHTQNLQYPRT